jgi:hypothetical protein
VNEPPSVLSLGFHTAFLPRLVRSRLAPGKPAEGGTSFNSNMELTVALFVCMALLALGTPSAVRANSVLGWILAAVGAAGILFILYFSVAGQRGSKPCFREFRAWIFLALVVLGPSAALFWGSASHLSRGVLIGACAAGLLVGYAVGILAGYWSQRLGWISGLLDGLAGVSIAGMVVADIVILSG